MSERVDANGTAYAGSQLQTQLYVNRRQEALEGAIREQFPELVDASFVWRSPLADDHYAEYYGSGFLKRLGLDEHIPALREFWPARGPQWDALALVERLRHDRPGILLVEGKSYPGEMLKGSPVSSKPGSENRDLIETSLAWTQHKLNVKGRTPDDWAGPLYQNANRLAHWCWLRDRGVEAWMLHLLFLNDPHRPTTREQWEAVVAEAENALGVDRLDLDAVGHVFLEAGTRDELVGNAGEAGARAASASSAPPGLTDYERKVEAEIEQWRTKPPSVVTKAIGTIEKPFTKPIGWVLQRTALDQAIKGALELVMDVSAWTVDEDRVLRRYRELGVEVSSIDTIRSRISLEDMDRHAISLAKAYRWSAAGEGLGAAGASVAAAARKRPDLAAAAVAADIVAITGLACRAVAHHAAVYGFRVESQVDREYALKALSGATAPNLAAKQAAFGELNTIALMVARQKSWEELRKRGLVKGIEKAAARYTITVTKSNSVTL